MNRRLLSLAVLLTLLAAALPAQHRSGRSFLRSDRTPATPAAPQVVEATANRTTAADAPLARLRSGRAWPRHHFGRLPVTPAVGATAQAADASVRRQPTRRRGFWRPR